MWCLCVWGGGGGIDAVCQWEVGVEVVVCGRRGGGGGGVNVVCVCVCVCVYARTHTHTHTERERERHPHIRAY